MSFQIRKATRTQSKARIGVVGPAGSGKTFTALAIMQVLAKKVVVIDTERESSEKYADEWEGFEYDVLPMDPPYTPQRISDAIKFCGDQGYDGCILDSLTHAWAGDGGALMMVDNNKAKSGGNAYYAWRDVTPAHNKLVDAMLQYPGHFIATMRAKTEYVEEVDNKGKKNYRKVGLAPIQREGMDYEFDIVFDIDRDHTAFVSKTRCRVLADKLFHEPGGDVGEMILHWLTSGAEGTPAPVVVSPKTQADLVEYGKKEFKMEPTDIGTALNQAGITRFDPDNWDGMIEALRTFSPNGKEEVAE